MKVRIFFFLIFQNLTFGQYLSDLVIKSPIDNPEETIIQLKTKIKSNPASIKNADYLYLIAISFEYLNKEDSAFVYLLRSKEKYEKQRNNNFSNEILLDIHRIVSSQNNYKSYGNKFLKEFSIYSKYKKDTLLLAKSENENGKIEISSFEETNKQIHLQKANLFFKKALLYAKKTKDEIFQAKILSNIGVLKKYERKIDSSQYFLKQAIILNLKNKQHSELYKNYLNYGNSCFIKKEYSQSLDYYNLCENIKLPNYKIKSLLPLFKKKYEAYDSLNQNQNRRKYFLKYSELKSSLDEDKQNEIIADYETQYKTQEKELQIVKLENHQIMNYSIIGFLIIIVTTSVLAYKNLSKKKKIIEQEKLLETQKLENTLKEQELHEIDVMLESQEKERQRIANELHDNLGSMLATLKLNFENLKRNDSNPTDSDNKLFEKTDDLIEEAYQKVRNISHLKNLGVIGSEGLVIAVKKMAEKMSVIEKLQINVIPHGLNERLENTLEVMLFRMIQELCTNIIKHSEATEVNIYLTQHNDNELNIIIEDNGKGFNPKEVVPKDGIGLKSIEKKVEQMNGTFTIDSIISKGTTIIIDLPI